MNGDGNGMMEKIKICISDGRRMVNVSLFDKFILVIIMLLVCPLMIILKRSNK